jgi:hypothetical protein
LRERGERYTAVGEQVLLVVGQDGAPKGHRDGFCPKRGRLTNAPASWCVGQTPSPYRYHPPRSRSRR